jgi:FAD/FMN-containing dehydrogenase
MSAPVEFATSLDGEVFTPDSAGYDAIRRPVDVTYWHIRPRLVVRCRSVSDVARVLAYASTTGERIAPRGGGHCFAGRSSTDGIVLDLTGIDDISVTSDGMAAVGAGARLGEVYAALHAHGRTLPAGCGPTVGIAGLTLGGGIGLLGRQHGLTCDRFVGAQVVLPDSSVVECDADRDPDLFWALRGAGGGQFGVVTSLRFDTVAEPMTTRIEAHWSGVAVDEVVTAWHSHRPPPQINERQTFVSGGIGDAIAAARAVAGDKDVALMGGGVVTEALKAGLVDELVLHQLPILLGAGRPFFQSLPEHVRLRLVEAVPAPGVTHLHYEVAR